MSGVPGSRPTLADVRVLPLETFVGEGTLVAIENGRTAPFVVERVFTVVGVPAGTRRGHHAHRLASQALVCLQGRCTVLCDDGTRTERFELTGPGSLLVVPNMIWASETFDVEGTVLLVLSDRPYEPDDYIRDYAEYLAACGLPR